jgi:rhodanese-related sulfurtransferase
LGEPMWGFLQTLWMARIGRTDQRKKRMPGISTISAAELASLFVRAPSRLMILDLRESAEIDGNPCAIPGALLTYKVNLQMLVPWIPPETTVILCSASDIPDRYSSLPVFHSKNPRFFALEGGLQSWHEAGLPTEQLNLRDEAYRRTADGNRPTR